MRKKKEVTLRGPLAYGAEVEAKARAEGKYRKLARSQTAPSRLIQELPQGRNQKRFSFVNPEVEKSDECHPHAGAFKLPNETKISDT